ncbi:MAG: hypothetical protein GX022_08820 [Clostridiaceae bacterium]|nr:hypothetical protein [Clostridiaceae bacterium]
MEKHKDNLIQLVMDHAVGEYYKKPKRILMVSDGLKYKKLSDDTILVLYDTSGIIVYEE